MGWFGSDWFGGIKDLVDNTLTSVLGDDIGSFLGSGGIGRAIENWSNPITQLSDRNPILNLVQGTGDWRGAYSEPNDLERFAENVTELGAMAYGGYSGAGSLFGGGGSGMDMMGLGGDVTSSTPFSGMGGGGGWLSSLFGSGGSGAGESSWLPNLFGKNNKSILALLGMGIGSDFLGGKKAEGDREQALNKYLNETTWTPDRKATYMSGLENLVNSIYSGKETTAKNTVAANLAGSGKGGGSFGSAAEKIGREKRELAAKALAQGLTTTSQPSTGLNAAMFMNPSAEASTLQGAGGMMGNLAQLMLLKDFLK